MSEKIIKDPDFVKCFKNRVKAIRAIHVMVAAKENNYTYKQILSISFFRNLFNEEYLKSTSSAQLEWRMKNIARDLKIMKIECLDKDWHELKNYFEGTRRKIKDGQKSNNSA